MKKSTHPTQFLTSSATWRAPRFHSPLLLRLCTQRTDSKAHALILLTCTQRALLLLCTQRTDSEAHALLLDDVAIGVGENEVLFELAFTEHLLALDALAFLFGDYGQGRDTELAE